MRPDGGPAAGGRRGCFFFPRAVPWVQSAHMTLANGGGQHLLGNLLINVVLASTKRQAHCQLQKSACLQGAVNSALRTLPRECSARGTHPPP